MNFVLAERYGHKMLIIENDYDECWVLSVSLYMVWFEQLRPRFRQLAGMNVKFISDKEALEMLQQYAEDPTVGMRYKIQEFLQRYKELPF